MLNHGSGQLVFARKLQTTRIGLVADNGSYPCAIALLPVVALGGFDDGSHVGAAARDENYDVALGCVVKLHAVFYAPALHAK